jgi:hypothetical protein
VSSFRWDIEAFAGPATEALPGGHSRLLVRVRMHDDGVAHPQPDVLCDLRPDDARELAFCLLDRADHADWLSASQPQP